MLNMQKKIAIIDLGSNSVRLVIFEIKSNGDAELELGLANENGEEFRKLFKRQLMVF
jgi:exopolyphosphatase/pppGpp-phosphohydrolase